MSSPFPQRLDDVPASARLPETNGWGFGAVAIGAVLVAVGYATAFFQNGFRDFEPLQWAGVAFLVALLSGGIEIARRLKPTCLAVHGRHLGIYRGGKLEAVVTSSDIGEYRLSIINTIREFFAFGVLGLCGTCGTMAIAGSSKAAVLEISWMLALGLTCSLGLASSIWTRALAKHYLIPKGGTTETVIFSKALLRRHGWIT